MTTRTVADACELSPVQQGMLFHTQLDPAAGLYVVQLWTPLGGPLDADAFRAAWDWAVQRHAVLRTSFVSEGLSRPMQVVHHAAALPWTALDWRRLSADEVDARKRALLAEDRARGFDLAAPPLSRLTLVRLADEEHLLLWTLHHLVLDGWSHTQVLREVLARYAALRGGAPFDPPAPRPYRDFVAWLRGRDAAATEAFWREALDGVREPTPLGIDALAGGADAGFADARRTLSPELTRALRERARAHRVTLNTLFQGAWALVLSRYAGEDDVLFGATVAGRPESLAGVEGMVGPFINTLPVRVRVPGEAQAGPWLAELQARQAAAREHEHTALVDLQGWTEVPRGRALFESILAFENFPRIEGAGEGTGGLTVGGLSGVSRTGYPLTLVVHPGDAVLLKAYADRARISDAAAERLLGHLESALRALAEAPAEARLGEIDLLTAEERAQVLAWGSNPTPAPAVVASIPEQVADQARRTPDAPAAEFADGTLTYRQLDARASQVARRLAALGVRPGDAVGLAAGQSAQMVAALLGIMRAGAAVVPLDPEYPEERLAFMVADTAARVLVTRGGAPAALAGAGVPVLDLDLDAAAIDAEDPSDPRIPVSAGAAAYVLFTSGSTGRPKGVVLSHGGLVRTVVGSDYATFGPGTRMAQQANLSFDAAAWELCGALLTGGTLVGIGRDVLLSADYGRELRARGITAGVLTTQLFNRHVRETPDVLATLDVACTGGEQADAAAMRACLEGGPPRRLLHIYGPTECSVFGTWHEVTHVAPGALTVPIGRPLAHTRTYVLDARGRPVPVGVGGELYLGGERTAAGYLGRPALTAERFVPDPFSGQPGARMYRTGDRVRWRESAEVRECGSAEVNSGPANSRTNALTHSRTAVPPNSRTAVLEFAGRLDGQVKVRGFRIETGEVEAALRDHPSVSHAAVIAREDAPGDRRLVAYVVGADGDAPGAAELRAHLARRLPEYMVPSAFVAMDALPITRNGKVDHRALPAPDLSADARGSVAPRDETEALLAALWGEVLGIGGVGVHDGFFAAGGHSLHAMQLATRVREALRVELPLRTLFDAQTVAELGARLRPDAAAAARVERTARLALRVRRMADAEVAEQLREAGVGTKAPTAAARRRALLDHLLRLEGAAEAEGADGIPARDPDAPARLSFAQERLWVMEHLHGGAAYTVPAGLRLAGALDAEALRRALEEVVRRHEALRTVFAEADGGPVQIVAPPAEFELPVEDLRAVPEAEREAALRAYATAESARPFDLRTGPLLRARLVRLDAEDHALLLFAHHMVADGWSLGVLYRELSALYPAFARGQASPLPPLPVQYADFAAWQRAHLAGDRLDGELAWWRERLEGLPEVLELPADRARPAAASHRGATLPVRIPREVADALRALSQREGSTLFMTLLAGFAALLRRYTGAEHLAVGSPTAGRTRPETEGLIGFFANTLVLRADLSGDPGFGELLRRVRETTLGAYAHQDVPFERLVDELKPERTLGHHPLVQVMFAVQNARDLRPRLDGLRVERMHVPSHGARVDLTLSLVEGEDGIGGLVEYATDLFDRGTVERMLEHFGVLLAAAAADPDLPVAALPMLPEAERRTLRAWSGIAPPLPRASVDRLFAEQAAATPDAVALEFGDARVTYAQLDAWANRFARHLRAAGVRPGTRVGLCLDRSLEMVVATLAIVKAGGAYVPLDPAYPAERLAFMLADTAAPVLVTDSRRAAGLPAEGLRTVLVDREAEAIAAASAEPLASETGPESVAYVMYTSGSTGRPKGIEIPHRGIVRLVRGMDFVSIDRSDVFLQLAPASFDPSTLEIWGPLLTGARLAIYPPERPSVEGLERVIARHGVTILWLTTGLFHLVVDEKVQALHGVRQLLAGGDVLSVPHVRRVLAQLPGTAMTNGYGPTENTLFTCCHRADGLAEDAPSVPIGRPIANTSAYVLDARMQPVPVGVPGELYTGGAGLAHGYLGRPALTAAAFVPSPFGDGERLYRTGDRVRWVESAGVRECVSAEVDPSASDSRTDALTHSRTPAHSRTFALEFLGRVDAQVKIRGYRIEPGEVEAVLRGAPGVREAAVVVREDAPGQRRLVAYAVGADADALRDFARQRLPEHMVPSAIVVMDTLPMTPSGKVDRRALPVPEASTDDVAYVAPATATEALLAGVWAEVLGIGRVGATDAFFELGGNSLGAMRAAARIRDALGVEVPLRLFFEAPTVKALAARLAEEEESDGALERRARGIQLSRDGASGDADEADSDTPTPVENVDAIVPRGDDGPAPLSFAQERLWLIEQLQPGAGGYTVGTGLRIRGAVDAQALGRALAEVVARHAPLRTRLVEEGGSAAQVIDPPGAVPLPLLDLSAVDAEARDEALREHASAGAARPFRLGEEAPLRASLVRLAGDDHALLLFIHHTAIDGWSLSILFRELDALYGAFRRGEPSPLPALPIRYADYAAWQHQALHGPALDRQLAWWRARLAGLPEVLELPTDRPRPAVRTQRGGTHRIALPRPLVDALHGLAQREGATLFMALLAGFQALLHRYTGDADFAVGTPVAGRARPETEGLVGLFVNTLVVRADLAGDPDVRTLLRRVREAALGAWAHQDVPFERLVDALASGRNLGHNPLFQVMFALQNAGDLRPRLDDLDVERFGVHGGGALFDLTWSLVETKDGITGVVEYAADLFDGATVARMAEHFRALLQAAVADPAARVSALPMVSDTERDALLGAWSGRETPAPRETIGQLFAARAAAAPEAVALAWDGETLSYAALDARASQLARHLRGLGVRHGTRVGICLERSPEMVVATLAVLRAGGAYVPLDPAYPAERLAFMLADTAVPVLLADSRTIDRIPPHDARTLLLDRDADAVAAESAEPVWESAAPESVACVMYTSGSTGTPRGIEVPHRAIVRLVRGADFIDVESDDVFLQMAPASFDAATLELWAPLLNGARLALYPPERPTVEGLAAEIARHGVTTLWLTAGLFHLVVEENVQALRGVRRLLAGGDVLSVPHVRRVLAELPGTVVINGYGPTENTTFTACHRIDSIDDDAATVPIGRPINCTRVYVLDAALRPVPAGVPGQLYAGGAGLAHGYLGRPARTAETFVPNPFGDGERLYATGDRVRWKESAEVRECVSAGVDPASENSRTNALTHSRTPTHSRTAVLEFLGRLDTQVKIRGYRVEPGEVEAALLAHPAVREGAVAVHGEGGDRRLVAYAAGEVDTDALLGWLRARLPEHMVPSAVVRMDALPLTANGKVDRRALPAPDAAAEGQGEYRAPRTETETLLADVWAEVLGAARVGIDDPFWEIGGHSLRAMRAAARIRDALRVDVPLRLFFEAPTVAMLAARLAEDEAAPGTLERTARLARLVRRMPEAEVDSLLEAEGAAVDAPADARRQALLDLLLRREGVAADEAEARVLPRDPSVPAPLSFAQERLWVMDQLQPGSAAYTISAGLRLRGALHVDALRRAFGEIVRRHEALRTTFPTVDGAPVQAIAPAGEIDIPLRDLSALASEEREEALRAFAADESARPFDLAKDDLVRIRLVRMGDDEHVLLVYLHHAVSDGWSMAVMYRELNALYAAFSRGEPSPLAPLAVQYADFAAWQRAHLAGPAGARQLAWWRARLAGLPEVLELPADRPRPPVARYRGAVARGELSPALAAALHELSRREGTTLFMTLLAGFAALLHRYTGEADVAVGTPVAGRTRPEAEALIGDFVNTLVLRTDLSGEPTFRALLGRVREATLGAYAHQDLPFERLVDELRPERSLSHAPLFQVMFGLQNAGDMRPRLDGIEVEGLTVHGGTTRYDLAWSLVERDGGVQAMVEYDTDLFDAGTVERMLAHFQALLAAAAADPAARVADLPLLSDEEREDALAAPNRTAAPYEALPIHRLVAAQAARTPHAVAVRGAGEALTYAQLDAASSRLARHLAGLGVVRGERLAISMERVPALLVAMLATWKTGAAYVPIDPAYPEERRAYMLADSGASVILTDSASADGLPASGGRIVTVDALDLSAEDASAPAVAVDADDVAYVIYTSGSTGRPKGVMVPHGGVANFLASMGREPGIAADDVLVAVTSLSFDIAVLELLLPLVTGAQVVVATREEATDATRLAALLDASGATVMQATPATWRALVQSGWNGRPELAVLCGGEALAPDLARELLPRGRALWNLYGPTETTIWSAAQRVEDAERITLGRPIANTRLYVLDPAGQPCPAGVPGELYIGGDGVVRGYLHRPALTAERFVPDAFSATPGARLYRTGDRVRRRESASVRECVSAEVSSESTNSRTNALTHSRTSVLEFLGRMDFQVKVRGFRIELGEIEAALAEHPAVRECVAVVREDAGDARIVAYIVPNDAAPAADVLREMLSRRLPDYMLPSAYVTLDALPLTPNGKVDRRALPAPEWSAGSSYVAPRDATEEALAALWAEVLGVEQVGVHDDFFARGGHSLRGTQLVTRIRAVFGVEVPLRALFEAPTVAGLARRVEQARGQETVLGADPVLAVPRDGRPLPLSFAQLRLWFLEQLEPDNARYNMAASLGLSGALDADVLQRALQAIVDRHESLRTTYGSDAGQPVQVIHPRLPFPLPLVDLTHLPEAEREPALARMGADEVDRPINLASGPVMRGHLYRLGDGEHVLLLVMHHVVTDGWSMGVMLRELRALYAAFLQGRPSPLAPLAVQYADYAAWQHGFLRGETLERQLGYWKDKLAGAPTVLELPSDRPRPAVQRYRGSHITQFLEPELARSLEALARREGSTLYMVLLAAFYTLLYRYTGQRDLLVGTPVANRMRPEVEELIGFFVNTLVLRTDLSGDPTFRELVARVRETALGAYAHQDVPFERLVEELGVPRDMSHEPLFQVMFVLQNVALGEVDLPGVTLRHRSMDRRTTKFDFTVFLWADDDGLRGWWEYNTDLWDRETVERLLGHYHTLLRALAADPDARIGTLPLLTAPERTQVLEAWNDTAAPEPEAPCVHQLVEAQVRRTPHEIAVVYEGERLTYAELNARANQLAHHLRELGVGPDRPVGICLERSLEMTVALLAILKAGGAVVAIDPTYPEERIAFMVRDAGLAALLTQETLAAAMPQAGTRVVLLDRGPAQFAHHSAEDPRVPVDARNLMYCIYTSGSTGIPKGVGVPHREFLNLLQWQWNGSGLARRARTVQFATFGFCVSFQECFGTWAAGSTLVVIPESRRRDLEALMEVLREERVERLYVPFAALKHLSEIPWTEDRLATTLREVVTAGEPLQVTEAMRAFFRRLGAVLHNQYGSSETHVVTALPLAGDPDGWPVRAPVGRPIANGRIYLLDAHLQPVPVGVPGEVCVGGEACLPRGYLGDPALTAAKLVPDPFSPVPGARMYRSGDVARQHRDGTIEVTGRLDLQIKIRGFRVEIGEVEAAIRRVAAVRDVAVVAGDNRFGEKRLVAYPVFRDGPVPAHELVEELKRRLPEYMIPTAWVPVDRLPVNANGKLDAAALPAPEEADAEGAEAYVAPRTATETALAEIWGEVLGKGGIGVRDNFFAVGGHSLLATQVMARVRDRCRADLPLRALFDNPTVETLARAVDAAARTDAPAGERVTARRRVVRTVQLAPVPGEAAAALPAAAGEPLAVGDD